MVWIGVRRRRTYRPLEQKKDPARSQVPLRDRWNRHERRAESRGKRRIRLLPGQQELWAGRLEPGDRTNARPPPGSRLETHYGFFCLSTLLPMTPPSTPPTTAPTMPPF